MPARALAGALAEPGAAQNETDALSAARVRRHRQAVGQRPLSRRSLSRFRNDPVYSPRSSPRMPGATASSTCRMPSSSIPRTWASRRRCSGSSRDSSRIEREQPAATFAYLRPVPAERAFCRSRSRGVTDAGPRARGRHARTPASMSLMNAVAHGKPSINPLRAALDPTDTQRLSTVLERLVAVAPRALPAAESRGAGDRARGVGPLRSARSLLSTAGRGVFRRRGSCSMYIRRGSPSSPPSARSRARRSAGRLDRGEMITNLSVTSRLRIADVYSARAACAFSTAHATARR